VLPHRFGDLECGWTSPPGVQHEVDRHIVARITSSESLMST
jgi:hypothetical protein